MTTTHMRPPEATRAQSKKQGGGDRKTACGFTILIVDDEQGVRKAIGRMLSKKYNIVEAESGPDAIKRYKEGGIDLIISDYNMTAEMNGLQLLKAVKAHDPAAKVITHAGGLYSHEREMLWGEGVFDILDKPALREDLFASICAALHTPLDCDMPMEEGIMGGAKRTVKVLFIEDDADTRFSYCEVGKLLGFEARAACNGREALGMLEGFKADVIVSDLHMPEMNGLEFLRELRSRDPQARVIIISGEANPQEIGSLADAGALRVLRKPIGIETLKSAIIEALA